MVRIRSTDRKIVDREELCIHPQRGREREREREIKKEGEREVSRTKSIQLAIRQGVSNAV
jgi:hypothetical protein